jgi:shikimate kinase
MAPVANKEDSPNLILAGFMGTGKSALGRQLAKRWRRRFYDTDELVEKLAGVSIADIFAQHGEEHFRALERQVVEGLLPENGAVIACGGGLVVPPGMGELVRSKGIVVALRFGGYHLASHRWQLASAAPQGRRPGGQDPRPDEEA